VAGEEKLTINVKREGLESLVVVLAPYAIIWELRLWVARETGVEASDFWLEHSGNNLCELGKGTTSLAEQGLQDGAIVQMHIRGLGGGSTKRRRAKSKSVERGGMKQNKETQLMVALHRIEEGLKLFEADTDPKIQEAIKHLQAVWKQMKAHKENPLQAPTPWHDFVNSTPPTAIVKGTIRLDSTNQRPLKLKYVAEELVLPRFGAIHESIRKYKEVSYLTEELVMHHPSPLDLTAFVKLPGNKALLPGNKALLLKPSFTTISDLFLEKTRQQQSLVARQQALVAGSPVSWQQGLVAQHFCWFLDAGT
jgi:hypothetical protein